MTRMPGRVRKLRGPYGKEPDLKNPGSDVFAPRAPRAKKNLKEFCRGNPATPHTPEIVFRPYKPEWACGWRPWRVVHRSASWHYSCWHREECTRCGKVTRYGLDREECPRYVPEPEGPPQW